MTTFQLRKEKLLLGRPCLKSYLFLGHRTPSRIFKTWCLSKTLMQLGVGAHSVSRNIQLEKVTPGLSTWLWTSDLTHSHRGMGFIFLLAVKEFELIPWRAHKAVWEQHSFLWKLFHTTWNNQILSWPERVLLDIQLDRGNQCVSPCCTAYFTLLCCVFNKTGTDIKVASLPCELLTWDHRITFNLLL